MILSRDAWLQSIDVPVVVAGLPRADPRSVIDVGLGLVIRAAVGSVRLELSPFRAGQLRISGEMNIRHREITAQ